MSIDQFFIDSCAALECDKVKHNDEVTVCRYPDGWVIMFANPLMHDNPSKMDLGRWCCDEKTLRRCLMGFWNEGKAIRPGEEFWK